MHTSTYCFMKSHPNLQQLKKVARSITAVISDVDGVFNDNRILEGAPFKPKFRSYYDGQGLSLLRSIGIPICLLTNEHGPRAKSIIDMVKKWNTLPSSSRKTGDGGWAHVTLVMGVGGKQKVQEAEAWLKKIGGTFDTCAYMGDDVLDAPLLRKVALAAAPAQAEEVIKNIVTFVARREGGSGAFRDLANLILEAKGIDPLELPFQ